MQWWGWLLVGLAVGAGLVAYWLLARRTKPAPNLREAWYKQRLQEDADKLNALREQAGVDRQAVEQLENRLHKNIADLAERYRQEGLDAAEIARRFRDLQL